MTFLELCQRLRQESGISGSGPITVVNQQAILAKVVEWVRQADLDIQRLHDDWNFRWRMGTSFLQPGVSQYLPAEIGLADSALVIRAAISGHPLTELPWQKFRDSGFLNPVASQRPFAFSFRPDGIVTIYPSPDQDYQIDTEHRLQVKPMVDDLDISIIPSQYHDVIVHRAGMYYASHEEDKTLLQVATQRYETALAELGAAQLPTPTMVRRGFR